MSHNDNHDRSHSRLPFLVLSIGTIIIGLWSYDTLRESSSIYDGVLQEDQNITAIVETASIGDNNLKVPSWNIFKAGQIWSLVSKAHPLPASYTPAHLVPIPMPHGDASLPMQVSSTIAEPLKALSDAASLAGYPLMVSSAYRSISDQKALYNSFVAKYGIDFAHEYVADPGTSEHHTGMAVDLSDKSAKCAADSNTCALSNTAADWLQNHAADYGFIQRYPEGDAPITGIAFEPWHYRYVGIPLAKAMAGCDLTLDQVVAQLAPAYAK